MARRRRTRLLDAALAYEHRNSNPYTHPQLFPIAKEHGEAWDDYEAARRDQIFAALHDAYVYPENEDNAALAALRDRLVELGLDRHIQRVVDFVTAKRDNEQLPF